MRRKNDFHRKNDFSNSQRDYSSPQTQQVSSSFRTHIKKLTNRTQAPWGTESLSYIHHTTQHWCRSQTVYCLVCQAEMDLRARGSDRDIWRWPFCGSHAITPRESPTRLSGAKCTLLATYSSQDTPLKLMIGYLLFAQPDRRWVCDTPKLIQRRCKRRNQQEPSCTQNAHKMKIGTASLTELAALLSKLPKYKNGMNVRVSGQNLLRAHLSSTVEFYKDELIYGS